MKQAIVTITLFFSLLLLAGCISWNTEVYPATSAFPKIAVDSEDNVHILWLDNRGRGDYLSSIWRTYYAKLDNSGKILVDNVELISPKKGLSHLDGLHQQIKVDINDNVFIAMGVMDYASGEPQAYYLRLDNKGKMLETYKELVQELRPSIVIDRYNNLHLAWDEPTDHDPDPCKGYFHDEIYYKKLDMHGNTLIGDYIQREMGYDKENRCSPKKSWIEGVRLTEIDKFNSFSPKIAVDSFSNAHIIWLDERNDKNQHSRNTKIYYTKLDTLGNTLIDDTPLECKYYYSQVSDFMIKVDSVDNLHIFWVIDNSEIYYTKLDKSGEILNACKQLNIYLGAKNNWDISIDSKNNIHVVWGSKNTIYYMKLDSYGNAIIKEAVISSPDDFISSNPQIAIDSQDNIHVVWMDQKDYPNDKGGSPERYSEGFYEIYYKKVDNKGNSLISDKRLTPPNDNVFIQFD